MKFLKALGKFIEAFLIFLVPAILFYWFLLLLNLSALKTLVALIGFVLDPIIGAVGFFAHSEIKYNNVLIDLTPLITAGVIFGLFIAFTGIGKILAFSEEKLAQAKIKLIQEEQKKQEEMTKIRYINFLSRNKFINLSIKFVKKEIEASYLYEGEWDFLSANQLDNIINNILDIAKEFNAKRCADHECKESEYNFIFENIMDAVNYMERVNVKIKEINRSFAEGSKRLYFSAACYCSYDDNAAVLNFPITNKILNLAGKNEIFTTELFRDKYEILNSKIPLEFNSKGIYHLNDNHNIEIFHIKIPVSNL